MKLHYKFVKTKQQRGKLGEKVIIKKGSAIKATHRPQILRLKIRRWFVSEVLKHPCSYPKEYPKNKVWT